MQESHLTKPTWCCRWAPTLGALEDTHQKVWGTKEYQPYGLRIGEMPVTHHDRQKPTVFFGIYGFPDFCALWGHQHRRAILWAGSDIRHFLAGYWLDGIGELRLDPKQLAPWIEKNCENYVENEVERDALATVGIKAHVVPSFLGDVTNFEVSYVHSERPKLYTSVSGDDFKLYGWDKIPGLAHVNPEIEFHLYGAEAKKVLAFFGAEMADKIDLTGQNGGANVIIHGRVPKWQMNREIKEMQGALRLTEFDGFSEILAKSILMGQYAVSTIPYPFTLSVSEIGKLKGLVEPNYGARELLLNQLNKYPWNQHA